VDITGRLGNMSAAMFAEYGAMCASVADDFPE
jgi:hypothetical protein